MNQLLFGKRAIVTGGAKGIGLAIAESFVSCGCKQVIILDKDDKALKQIPGRQFYEIVCIDITKKGDLKKLQRLLKINPIDILVNNAAITQGDDHEAIMRVNVDGTRNVTELVLPGMKKMGKGSVIFITSVHTALAFRGDAAYDSSKHAVVGYMRARAVEYAPYGLRLNAVAPGAIIHAGPNMDMEEGVIEMVARKIPAKRWGKRNEVADTVAFLASDYASYIVGQEIRVDGGMSIDSQFR